MTDADLAVTAVLRDAVLGMVRASTPATGELADWAPYEPAARCTAVVETTSRVESDPAAQRRRAWTTSS